MTIPPILESSSQRLNVPPEYLTRVGGGTRIPNKHFATSGLPRGSAAYGLTASRVGRAMSNTNTSLSAPAPMSYNSSRSSDAEPSSGHSLQRPAPTKAPQNALTTNGDPVRDGYITGPKQTPAGTGPKINTLRRKPSLINTYVQTRGSLHVPNSGTATRLLKISTTNTTSNREHVEPPPSASSSVTEFEDLDMGITPVSATSTSIYHPAAVPPPSITPSTRNSDSPGPFSHVTTPTSMSSYSSHITSSPGNKSSVFGISPGDSNAAVRRLNSMPAAVARNGSSLDTTRRQPRKPSNPSPLYTTLRTNSPEQMAGQLVENSVPRSVPTTYRQSPIDSGQEKVQQSSAVPPFSTNVPRPPLAPPELAHLMDIPSCPLTSDGPPSRPSRDGTPSLDQQAAVPIIHSRLPPLQSPFLEHARPLSSDRGSSFSAASSSPSKFTTNRARSQPSPQLPTSSKSTPRPPSQKSVLRKPKPIDFEAQSKAGSKFGFFSRKPKVEGSTVEQDGSKKGKKGPMAGTGHERYAKYSSRRRSGTLTSPNGSILQLPSNSSTGSLVSERKSISSSRSASDVDTFISERLEPIVIRGEGDSTRSSMNKAPTATSSPATFDGRSQFGSSIGSPRTYRTSDSSAEVYAFNVTQPLPSHDEVGLPAQSAGLDRCDGEFVPNKTKSPARKGFFGGRSGETKTASPIKRSVPRKHNVSPHALGITLTDSDFREANAAKKSGWSRFGRTRSPAKTTRSAAHHGPGLTSENNSAIAAQVDTPLNIGSRSIAHYELLDAQDKVDIQDLAEIMREAEAFQQDEESVEPLSGEPTNKTSPGCAISLSEDLPPLRSELDAENADTPAYSSLAEQETSNNVRTTARPSRLAQVGRIPKVVSKRDRTRTFSDASFSRPFVRAQPMPQSQYSGEAVAEEFPSRPISASRALSAILDGPIPPSVSLTTQTHQSTSDLSKTTSRSSGVQEFFSIPPQNYSDHSYSSSSGTMYMLPSTSFLSESAGLPSEDELWREYDDLLDDIFTPMSPESQHDEPATAQLDASHSLEVPEELDFQSNEPTPTKLAMEVDETVDDIAIRRPKILAALQLTTPTSESMESNASTAPSGREAQADESRAVSPNMNSALTCVDSPPVTSLRKSMLFRNSRILSITESPDNRISLSSKSITKPAQERRKSRPESANLRFGALMVSKWLSFGRVLFSPAHFELVDVTSDRVLVIDGLGKDWSYWCALTYSNAEVYNLGPHLAEGGARKEVNGFKSLPNHRYIPHADMSTPLPFPRGFFAAVVYRFPVVASEEQYRLTLAECKRVLRPSGFLEVSMLDLDMNNMGNQARRAVRSVKTKLREKDPNFSLQPPADSIIRLLGRRGFENLNRCVVGIPACGKIADAIEELITEGTTPVDSCTITSSAGDENITKTVSRIGRWWYTRCFERLVLDEDEPGIWEDPALLAECEDLQTSFKLLICYAQKPSLNNRRTVSL